MLFFVYGLKYAGLVVFVYYEVLAIIVIISVLNTLKKFVLQFNRKVSSVTVVLQ